MRPWTAVGTCAALGAIGFLTYETRRLAELAGHFEAAARTAEAEARAVAGAPAPTQLPVGSSPSAPAVEAPSPSPSPSPAAAVDAQDPVAYARLALDLATTRQQLAAVTALLEQKNQDEARRAEAAAAAAERANRPMAQGVRECLVALHECLRAEGFFGPRFLRAESVGQDGLTMVEMLDGDAAGLDVAVLRAARVTATLDRGRGRFELRFFEGERAVRGERTALPKDGFALAFDDVDGRAFEARLPYLLRCEGVYPEPEAKPGRPATDVDPLLRRQWLARLDRVLAAAGSQPAWRVSRFRGMENGWFLTGELVSTDDKHHVVGGAHCERFCIETDATTGLVSLLLRDGSLRRGTLESSITGEGYRVLLPNLTCKQAADAMFGLVVTK